MKKMMTLAICAMAITFAAPAAAQDRTSSLGPLWNISTIEVLDGHFEEDLGWLNDRWRGNQAFAKQQGWILDYHILSNSDARDGEADLYLITRYADEPNVAEIERRDAVMLRRMQTTAVGAEQQSAARGTMRRQMGSMTLREMLPARR
jgi:hypothetical protein